MRGAHVYTTGMVKANVKVFPVSKIKVFGNDLTATAKANGNSVDVVLINDGPMRIHNVELAISFTPKPVESKEPKIEKIIKRVVAKGLKPYEKRAINIKITDPRGLYLIVDPKDMIKETYGLNNSILIK